ncbi:MvdC/MvdD family ATP grasp protein [Helicobacter heilmannii]|uniref:MvdC/MvdD family ATP grasp protein n=1 Tax=Helicobacter heilmannii TaxID=35817 RepID=UPI002554A50A|nr:hypothetical protein [Helicobacter heilmannii]
MILILADAFDAHADRVERSLKQEGVAYFRFNLDFCSLSKTLVSFDGSCWFLRVGERSVSSDMFSCVWCRRAFVELSLEERRAFERDNDFKIWRAEWNATLLGIYTSLRSLPWLNPLRKALQGENKYYQMELAHKAGFLTPPTIVSNDKQRLVDFCLQHQDDALFKMMSQEVYWEDNTIKGFYTNRLGSSSITSHFSPIGENPIVLQKYMPKQYEVRWTVVGREHFVCRIDSQKSSIACHDWRRYDIAHTPHSVIAPAPESIVKKVNILLDWMCLEYGALDFIVTPENEWIFLEINCMGQWLWIEDLTNLGISNAITKWLTQHSTVAL